MRRSTGRPGAAKQFLHGTAADPSLRYEFDRGSHYESDTRLTQALLALIPDEDLHHPDHRFFQLNHLITEYSWVILHDCLVKACDGIGAGELLPARRALDRAITVADLPLQCVRILQDSLPQLSLLAMRAVFPVNATGLDSPGMRNLRRACRAVWAAFTTRLDAAGPTLSDLLRLAAPGSDGADDGKALADLMTALYRVDSRMLEWKRAHLQLVWMTVGGGPGGQPEESPGAAADGIGPTSIRGAPVSELQRLAARPMFPELWDLTTSTFGEMATGSGPYTRLD
jgi:tryptophan 2,3-dioxygenase